MSKVSRPPQLPVGASVGLMLGPTLHVIGVSPAVAGLLGRGVEDVLGAHLADLLPSAPLAEAARMILSGRSAGSTYLVSPPEDQEDEPWIQAQIAPMICAKGEVQLMLSLTDVSEAKRVRDDLDESRRLLESLMGNLPGMAYRCRNDRDWSMEFASSGALELTGYTVAELTAAGPPFYNDLIHPEDQEEVWERVQAGVNGRRRFRLEYRIFDKQGEERWVWEQGCAVLGPDGEVQALEGFISDITARRALESHVMQAHKMEAVGRLAAGVAHDFNNLLTVVLARADLLRVQVEGEASLTKGIAQIHAAAMRAADLTRQLQTFGRPFTVSREARADLNGVVTETMEFLRPLFGPRVQLEVELDPDLMAVQGAPSRLQQLLVNLALNARDAMPDGGRLLIGTRRVGRPAPGLVHPEEPLSEEGGCLIVEDTGIGMDARTRTLAFEPFFTSRPGQGGSGLGLSIVYGIVRDSSGDIHLRSEPGQGTRFEIFLPLAQGSSLATSEPVTPRYRGRRHETVLAVEDEPSVRRLLGEVLEGAGYRVIVAGDAREALERLEAHEGALHLMVTDVVMPGLNGRELAEQVTQARPSVRVIYLSGHTDDDVLARGIARGKDHFLRKPFTARELLMRVRMVLDLPAGAG